MAITEDLERLVNTPEARETSSSDQLKDLAEVEQLLRSVGVELESHFEIPLRARIGTAPWTKDKDEQADSVA